jgi:hypothetical protein
MPPPFSQLARRNRPSSAHHLALRPPRPPGSKSRPAQTGHRRSGHHTISQSPPRKWTRTPSQITTSQRHRCDYYCKQQHSGRKVVASSNHSSPHFPNADFTTSGTVDPGHRPRQAASQAVSLRRAFARHLPILTGKLLAVVGREFLADAICVSVELVRILRPRVVPAASLTEISRPTDARSSTACFHPTCSKKSGPQTYGPWPPPRNGATPSVEVAPAHVRAHEWNRRSRCRHPAATVQIGPRVARQQPAPPPVAKTDGHQSGIRVGTLDRFFRQNFRIKPRHNSEFSSASSR